MRYVIALILLMAGVVQAHECHFESLPPPDGSAPIAWQDGLNAALAEGDGALLEFHGLQLRCSADAPATQPAVEPTVAGCKPELAITRKGRFDVLTDGALVSSHNVFQEAVQAAVNSGGGAIRAPGYEVIFACR